MTSFHLDACYEMHTLTRISLGALELARYAPEGEARGVRGLR